MMNSTLSDIREEGKEMTRQFAAVSFALALTTSTLHALPPGFSVMDGDPPTADVVTAIENLLVIPEVNVVFDGTRPSPDGFLISLYHHDCNGTTTNVIIASVADSLQADGFTIATAQTEDHGDGFRNIQFSIVASAQPEGSGVYRSGAWPACYMPVFANKVTQKDVRDCCKQKNKKGEIDPYHHCDGWANRSTCTGCGGHMNSFGQCIAAKPDLIP